MRRHLKNIPHSEIKMFSLAFGVNLDQEHLILSGTAAFQNLTSGRTCPEANGPHAEVKG